MRCVRRRSGDQTRVPHHPGPNYPRHAGTATAACSSAMQVNEPGHGWMRLTRWTLCVFRGKPCDKGTLGVLRRSRKSAIEALNHRQGSSRGCGRPTIRAARQCRHYKLWLPRCKAESRRAVVDQIRITTAGKLGMTNHVVSVRSTTDRVSRWASRFKTIYSRNRYRLFLTT